MNEGNGGFIWKRFKYNQISSTGGIEGFLIENCFTKNPNRLFKASSGQEWINIYFEKEETVGAVALINHSLPSNSVIRLSLKNNQGEVLHLEDFPYSENNIYLNVEGREAYRITIYIECAVDFYIGEIFVGEVLQFPHNYSWGYYEEYTVDKEVITTDGGVHFVNPDADDEPVAEFRQFILSFDNVKPGHYETFYPLIRPRKLVFIPNFQEKECYYGVVKEDSIRNKRLKIGDSYSFSFLEDGVLK